MRLVEAILDANKRRLAGESDARIPTSEVAASLPIAALTCIDSRLNRLLPEFLGVSDDHFIWLRNAGNIITGPLSSTMRSLSLGCAVKGAKEIAVIGHTDCQVCKTTMLQLLERLNALGVDRHRLPENLVEYFGLFSSERQNVIRAAEIIRGSPLIGSKIPVHGLLIDIASGRLEWVLNGYDNLGAVPLPGNAGELLTRADAALDKMGRIGSVIASELNLPTSKIGEFTSVAQDVLHKAERIAATVLPASAEPPAGSANEPPKVVRGEKGPPTPLATLQERMRQFSATRPGRQPGRKP